jgi:hypothetical protein
MQQQESRQKEVVEEEALARKRKLWVQALVEASTWLRQRLKKRQLPLQQQVVEKEEVQELKA